jgi:5-methylcytosine-specific restriction endonuclease McrA
VSPAIAVSRPWRSRAIPSSPAERAGTVKGESVRAERSELRSSRLDGVRTARSPRPGKRPRRSARDAERQRNELLEQARAEAVAAELIRVAEERAATTVEYAS